PRRIRRHDRRRARRCLEVRDPPSLLWRCQRERPCFTHQGQLRCVVDEAKKPYATPKVKRLRETFQLGAVVASPGNRERGRWMLQRRERADDEIHALVLLEPSEIDEQRLGR